MVGFLVILLPLVLLWYHGRYRVEPTVYERVLVRFTSPAQALMSDIVGGVGMLWGDYIWITGVQQENRLLTTRNRELEAQVVVLDKLQTENSRLKELLSFKGDRPDLVTIAAGVIAKDISPFHRVLKVRISAGGEDGVRRYQAVVTPAGVVGHVDKMAGRYAEVKLAVDAGSSISVSVEGRDVKGVAVGSGDRNSFELSLTTLEGERGIYAGDRVVTNGEDERYPRGLLVGHVADLPRIHQEVGFQYVLVPAVDFSGLEHVLLVTSELERLPPMGQ